MTGSIKKEYVDCEVWNQRCVFININGGIDFKEEKAQIYAVYIN